jgi:glutamate-5-semialdehyde dehydrogenase
MLIADSADPERIIGCVDASLDRKVCNTVNVICVPRVQTSLIEAVLVGLDSAASRLSARVRLHVVGDAADHDDVSRAVGSKNIDVVVESESSVLATEWEWDAVPEVSIRLVDDLEEAIGAFNQYSPLFVVSVVTSDPADVDAVYRRADAPFVGDGFTRWVDGQYALSRPELGLSNWQGGRLFARGGILSGDGVYSVRYRATHTRPDQRR